MALLQQGSSTRGNAYDMNVRRALSWPLTRGVPSRLRKGRGEGRVRLARKKNLEVEREEKKKKVVKVETHCWLRRHGLAGAPRIINSLFNIYPPSATDSRGCCPATY